MKEKIFEEITNHLVQDTHPSDYINELSDEDIFNEFPLILLKKLKKTEQSIQHHPEGNVWNHTMLVLDEAAKVREQSKDKRVFMWSALLHDIGKPDTTRNRKGKITSYDHDKVGADLCMQFLLYYTQDREFIQKVANMVRYHMHMLYVLKDLPFGNTKAMIKEVKVDEIALLCFCDRLGRKGADILEEEKNYRKFIERLEQINKKVIQVQNV